jgi:mannose-6-phosphate isomerase
MHLLDNPIRFYPWGSRTAIPELLGVEPTGDPQAELWMGAHPSSPSRLVGDDASLLEVGQADPATQLGPACLAEFGPRLPFLLKVLAAEEPLSLQVHPDPEQARLGFERENAAGIPLDAPHRNYKDPHAKPEAMCALTAFETLAGFRPPEQTLELVGLLGAPALDELVAPLRVAPDAAGLREVVTNLLTAPADRRRVLVTQVLDACKHVDHPVAAVLSRLGQRYPDDAGVVAALLLNHVRLAPGEALYLPAGNLHAHLGGVGVEILANSDNVLRGGLTGKHVDVPELLKVLDFTPTTPEILRPDRNGVYPTPAKEFRLARHDLTSWDELRLESTGPQILLCVEGQALVRSQTGKVTLTKGRSAYAGAHDGVVHLSGQGVVFQATAGLG